MMKDDKEIKKNNKYEEIRGDRFWDYLLYDIPEYQIKCT